MSSRSESSFKGSKRARVSPGRAPKQLLSRVRGLVGAMGCDAGQPGLQGLPRAPCRCRSQDPPDKWLQKWNQGRKEGLTILQS